MTSPGRPLRWIAILAAAAALAAVSTRPESNLADAHQRAALLLETAERQWRDTAFAPAIRTLEEAQRLGRELGDSSVQAAAIDLLGCVYDGQGLGERGLASHRQALGLARSGGDRRLEGRILAHTALGFWTRAEYAEAEASCAQALAVQRSIGDRSGEAASLDYLGLIHYKRGEYDQAVEVLRSALSLQRGAGESAQEAWTLLDLAQVHRDLRQHATAVELYGRALAILEQLGDRAGQSEVLVQIGVAYVLQGADRDAVGHFQRALELADQIGSETARASALHHLGIAYSARGWYERAAESYAASLALREALGDPRAQAWIWARLGRVSARQGNDAEALDRYRRATEIWETISDRRALASHLNNVAATYERLGDDRRALAVYLRAAELGTEIRLPYRSLSLGSIGKVYARLGERERALAHGDRAVAEANQSGNPEMRWSAYYALGSIQVELGLPDAALRSFEESLRIIEDLRDDGVRSDEAKAAYMDSKQQVYADAVAVLMAAGRPGPALELAERARARAFLDLLGSRPGARQLSGGGLGGVADAAVADAGLSDRSAGSAGRSDSTADIASPASIAAPSLAQLQTLARRHGEPIVEYLVADRAVFIWVVDPDGRVRGAISKVRRAELDQLVETARRSLRADTAARDWRDDERAAVFGERPAAGTAAAPAEPGDSRAVLRRLHELLVEPIEAWLPADPERPVTVVPHGKLFLVSFAALRDGADRYLLERHVLHYSPAISVLRYTGRAPDRRTAPAILVVGNPAMPTLPGRTRPLSPLPGAEREAQAIGSLFPPAQVTALIGKAALEQTVRGLAAEQSILHVATHGVIRDDDPLASLLALAPGGAGSAGDGLWTAREVFDLRLSADLVTLSACNTGLGEVSGDGVIGLSRAFLYAGAPSVLVSLWRVADSVTRFEMERFYGELIASSGAKAHALRRAQLDTIAALRAGRLTSESGKPLPEDPAYWAPFVLVGEAN